MSKSNIAADTSLSRLTTEVKHAITERAWSRYGFDASSTNGHAQNAITRWNRAERKLAKQYCKAQLGKAPPAPRMGTYHALGLTSCIFLGVK